VALAKRTSATLRLRYPQLIGPEFPEPVVELARVWSEEERSSRILKPVLEDRLPTFRGILDTTADDGTVWEGGLMRFEFPGGDVLLVALPGRGSDVSPAIYRTGRVGGEAAAMAVKTLARALRETR
jgi:hypothetical protein